MEMTRRPRRLRGNETLRKMVRETRMDKSSLIYPIFVKDGKNIKEEIPSMEGQFRYSVDQLPYALEEIAEVMSKVSLGQLDAHCILYDLNGYYDSLKALLAKMIEKGLSTPQRQQGIRFAANLEEITTILNKA